MPKPRAGSTISPGVSYGTTSAHVIAHLEKTQKIVSREDSRIVAEGYDGVWEMKRRNIFTFQGSKLAVHDNIPAGD